MTPDRIRSFDLVTTLIEENKNLNDAINQQRNDMDLLHQKIGGLEWKLMQRDREIKNMKRNIQAIIQTDGTGTP